MTFQERWAEGPEDAPSSQLVDRLARALWAAGELSGAEYRIASFDDLAVADSELFLERAADQIRAGKQHRAVCLDWAGVHADPIVIRAGLEPVTHGMCDDCHTAMSAELE